MQLYIELKAITGTNVRDAIVEAMEISLRLGVLTRLEFNGKVAYVSWGSDLDNVLELLNP